VLRVVGDVPDARKAVVGDLDHPATVQQTVATLEASVKLQRALVNVLHPLCTSTRSAKVNWQQAASRTIVQPYSPGARPSDT